MATCRSGSMIWRLAAVLVVFLSSNGNGYAQGAGAQVPSVPEAVAQCMSCHGPFGRPENLEYPIIGGQNAAYLASALRAYRGGQRSGENAQIMATIVQPLDDQTIDDLAADALDLGALRARISATLADPDSRVIVNFVWPRVCQPG